MQSWFQSASSVLVARLTLLALFRELRLAHSGADMTTSTGKPDSAKDRYHRYLPIIEFVASQPAFDVDAVKHTVEYERPAFIARVVKELSEEGWLICEEDGTYRWNTGRGEFSVTKWIDDRLVLAGASGTWADTNDGFGT